jgi:hypothetical protein
VSAVQPPCRSPLGAPGGIEALMDGAQP